MYKIQISLLLMVLMLGSTVEAIDIFHAIKQNNVKEVKLWQKSHPDTKMCNSDGQSILHVAVLSGKKKMVKMILKSDLSVNAVDRFDKTALDYAVEAGKNSDIILNLVQHKARVTSYDRALLVSKVVQRANQWFWFTLAIKVGVLMPLMLVVGTLLGFWIVESLLGFMVIQNMSTLAYCIVGGTIAMCQWILVPWYLALPFLPLGCIWADIVIVSQGMVFIGLPVALSIGLCVGVIGVIRCMIYPKPYCYMLPE